MSLLECAIALLSSMHVCAIQSASDRRAKCPVATESARLRDATSAGQACGPSCADVTDLDSIPVAILSDSFGALGASVAVAIRFVLQQAVELAALHGLCLQHFHSSIPQRCHRGRALAAAVRLNPHT